MTMGNSGDSTIRVGDAVLYHEIRGEGPPVLFVSGATGDAGIWSAVADDLATDHTVVTYDRRGNSRSPGPEDWASTSVEEQADDAAGLLEAIGLSRATVVGTSSGAIISLGLVERHPQRVDAALLHEPPLTQFLPEGSAPTPASIEEFLRFALGDEVFEQLDPALRSRMLGNGDLFLEREFDHFEHFRPDIERIRSCGVPIALAAGRDNADDPALGSLHEGATKLAETLGFPLQEMSGKHVPYLSCPEAFSVELREILRKL